MQQGQILVNKDGEKRKILFVSGDLVVPTEIGNFEKAAPSNYTKTELLKLGWSPLEEPWKPTDDVEYVWIVNSFGEKIKSCWGSFNEDEQNFLLKTNNYSKEKSDAEAYKQKLIERMGSKE